MRNEESKIQQSCIKIFELKHPKLKPLLFAIPNGGNRNALTGAILKAEGARAGIPDLMLAYPKGSFAGLFIEMKTPKGTIKPHQKEYLELLASVGYKTAICRTVEEFIILTDNYLTNGK